MSDDGTDADPCAADFATIYDQGLHIGGIFVLFLCSLLGVVVPLIGAKVPSLALPKYALVCGKCAGIGILLACALVHMLQPATEELGSECLSKAFTEDYGAYPFLFAMLAMLVMHFVDFVVESAIEGHIAKHHGTGAHSHGHAHEHNKTITVSIEGAKAAAVKDEPNTSIALDDATTYQLSSQKDDALCNKTSDAPACDGAHTITFHVTESTEECPALMCDSPSEQKVLTSAVTHKAEHHHHDHHDEHHGHSHGAAAGHSHVHSVLLIEGMQRTVAAYLLEFGVSVHSVLIGLTTGVVAATQLKTLLVALAFHQCFEGVALGSRIADAELVSGREQIGLSAIFVLSSPVGMAIGVGLTSSLNPNGPTYNYTAGIFDSVCAGILLYIGLVLLLKDFPEDMKTHAKTRAKKAGMFITLWVAAGIMAFLGKYA